MFESGKKYMICLPQGWVLIGECVEQSGPFAAKFRRAHYVVRTGGQPWGILASNTTARQTAIFRPIGVNGEALIGSIILWACEWAGELP